ncbi:MAG: NADH:ubiquinone reductase (Na(+)-transporting) subunit E [Spirochaetales bacterium]|nr:NADH:ubiquinone reductase (Na(+)-transporting) subunit E [Spirochaetales bacterium]
MKIIIIILASALTNNIALTFFLGMCPFIAISKNIRAASGMGLAVTYVMVLTALINYILYYTVLIPLQVEYLSFIVFIVSIAALVQMLEILLERFIPPLYATFGIFLPLITVNCAILGVSLFMILREYTFFEALAFSFGSGIGWLIAITAMAGLRKYLAFSKPVKNLGEAGITVILLGLMALAFLGFSGMLS